MTTAKRKILQSIPAFPRLDQIPNRDVEFKGKLAGHNESLRMFAWVFQWCKSAPKPHVKIRLSEPMLVFLERESKRVAAKYGVSLAAARCAVVHHCLNVCLNPRAKHLGN